MTTIRWTEPASTNFLGIVEWLQARNPAAAAKAGRRILDAVEILKAHPQAGRQTQEPMGVSEFGRWLHSVRPARRVRQGRSRGPGGRQGRTTVIPGHGHGVDPVHLAWPDGQVILAKRAYLLKVQLWHMLRCRRHLY